MPQRMIYRAKPNKAQGKSQTITMTHCLQKWALLSLNQKGYELCPAGNLAIVETFQFQRQAREPTTDLQNIMCNTLGLTSDQVNRWKSSFEVRAKNGWLNNNLVYLRTEHQTYCTKQHSLSITFVFANSSHDDDIHPFSIKKISNNLNNVSMF